MSKAVLVVNATEKCINCDISYQEDGSTDVFCTKMGCVSAYDEDDEKPDWCPLRPMPEERRGFMGTDNAYEQGWGFGFNACLSEIAGDKE